MANQIHRSENIRASLFWHGKFSLPAGWFSFSRLGITACTCQSLHAFGSLEQMRENLTTWSRQWRTNWEGVTWSSRSRCLRILQLFLHECPFQFLRCKAPTISSLWTKGDVCCGHVESKSSPCSLEPLPLPCGIKEFIQLVTTNVANEVSLLYESQYSSISGEQYSMPERPGVQQLREKDIYQSLQLITPLHVAAYPAENQPGTSISEFCNFACKTELGIDTNRNASITTGWPALARCVSDRNPKKNGESQCMVDRRTSWRSSPTKNFATTFLLVTSTRIIIFHWFWMMSLINGWGQVIFVKAIFIDKTAKVPRLATRQKGDMMQQPCW